MKISNFCSIFYRLVFLSFWIFLSTSIFAQEVYTVKTVPNPRTIDSTWVSDPGSLIPTIDLAQINQLIDQIEKETTVEIAVVVLPSIGDEIPKDFAVDLFNTWGIGKKEKDNGLLLLIVMDQRRWEFETGYGLEGDLPDVILKRIGESKLVPGLRANQIGSGIYDSIKAVGKILNVPITQDFNSEVNAGSGSDRVHDLEYEDNEYYTNIAGLSRGEQNAGLAIVGIYSGIVLLITFWYAFKTRRRKKNTKAKSSLTILKYGAYWLIPGILILSFLYFGSPKFLIAIYYPIAALWAGIKRIFNIQSSLSKSGDPYSKYKQLRETNGAGLWILAVIFPIPVALIAFYFVTKLRKLRMLPRDCPNCNTQLNRLDEEADDFFLDEGQKKEEKLGSVDYDVWHCNSCDYVKVLAYDAFATSYSKCSSCKYKTYHTVADRTIRSPTCNSSGKGERDYKCENCNFTKTETYTIPARDCSSSSSSSGSSYRSSSSSSSSSFGGGRSGGGGAGGSW